MKTQITLRTDPYTRLFLSILLKELKEIPFYSDKNYSEILISALKFKVISYNQDVNKLSFEKFFELETNLIVKKVLEIDKKEMKSKYELTYKYFKYHYTDFLDRLKELKKSKYFSYKIFDSKDYKQLFFKSSVAEKETFVDLLEYIQHFEKTTSEKSISRDKDILLLDLTFEFLMYVSQNMESKKTNKYLNRIIERFDKEINI